METVVAKTNWFTPALRWESLIPQCSWTGCRNGRARWQGLFRRGEGIRCEDKWLCSAECLQQFLNARFLHLLREPPTQTRTPAHRIPLGLLLLSRGQLDHEVLQQGIAMQRARGERIGDCLKRVSSVSEAQITSALAKQWSCPVYPIARGSECRHMVPRRLQEFHGMLPVHFVPATRDLYIAFEQFIDYTVLFAIEQMLDCHTRPCIAAESELRQSINEERADLGNLETVFESVKLPAEFARNISGYAQQVGAERLTIVGCGAHIWTRLEGSRPYDLLVRRWHE